MAVRKYVTIRDVAQDCGLALSTVSNALAGKQYVRAETRKLVSESAQRLGYRASSVARALRMQRSFTIGVLVADIINPAYPDFVRGIEDVAIREHCNMFVCNTENNEERQLWHMRALLDRQVDGMVLISQYVRSRAVTDLLNAGTPCVLVQRRNPERKDDYVGSNNVDGITAAVEHLHALGHRRIGFIHGPLESTTAVERLNSFQNAVRRLRLSDSPSLVFAGDYSLESGMQAGLTLLHLRAPPTAIMANNDVNAIGVIEAARSLAIEVPKQLSVIGLDGIQLSAFPQINLTTILVQKRAIGAAAAELLMKRIRAKRNGPRQEIIVDTELRVRGTTAPPHRR